MYLLDEDGSGESSAPSFHSSSTLALAAKFSSRHTHHTHITHTLCFDTVAPCSACRWPGLR